MKSAVQLGELTTLDEGGSSGARRRRLRWPSEGSLFVLPAVVVFAVFVVYPVLSGLYYSLFNWPGYGARTFVGLGNFGNLSHDSEFYSAVKVTVVFTVCTTVLQTVVPMFMAIFLSQKWRGATIFRTIIFIPSIISLTITGLLWQLALQPNGGLVDTVLADVGLGSLARPWLGETGLVVPVLVVVSLWQSLGFYLLIYYAGLQSIDGALYESAEVDGASGWQMARAVTIPGLRAITTVVVSLNLINGVKVFDIIYAMTSGGPGIASQSLGVYLFQLAFGSENGGLSAFGYADAIGVVMMFAAAVLFMVVNIARRER
jgi:ABC-type sugar transport system permease subunit